MTWLTELARPEIVALKAYEHASWEPTLERLHANELPWRALGDDSSAGLNCYPEPQPRELIERLAALYEVPRTSVIAGRGSDEAIDLLIRAFCRAGQDRVLICPPTFGMYAVAARIQGAGVQSVPLRADQGFALDESAVIDQCDATVKLVFLCSPNNPTGNLLDETAVLRIADRLAGRALLVVDEAYVEFSGAPSLTRHLDTVPHLAILRTLSKAHGLAGARCGTLIANPEVIALLRKIIPPYAIPQLAVEAVLKLLGPAQLALVRARIDALRNERQRLAAALESLANVSRVWPSAANFLMVEFRDAAAALSATRSRGLLIRDVRSQPKLGNALRISVGTEDQNDRLLGALR